MYTMIGFAAIEEEKKDDQEVTVSPISIAIIGGGPSGLALCHKLESFKHISNREVSVTCFERSSVPGGVWQSNGENETQMYDNLWTNGASHNLEFHDYTFDEHFKKPISVYMKRQELLDYILGRVTHKCSNFFEKYMRFNSEVTNVVFDEAKQMFDIKVKDTKNGTISKYLFHKFVWACGDNGKPKIPTNVKSLLCNDGFKGKILHSSKMKNFEEDVRGKRVVLIGAGFSAEDLALQAIKCGVEKVFIISRNEYGGEGTQCEQWPTKKVSVRFGYSISGVFDEGKSVKFKGTKNKWPLAYEENPDVPDLSIRNVDTIIFCTGYHSNTQMLDEALKKGFPDGSYSREFNYEMPAGWKMKQNNLTSLLGDVMPDIRYMDPSTMNQSYYRGVNMSNPNMMILSDFGFEDPLLSIDIHAHLLAQYLNGMAEIPSRGEVRKEIESQFLHEMEYPHRRYLFDLNYAKAIDALDLWEDYYEDEEETALGDGDAEEKEILMILLGKVAKQGNYPLKILGEDGNLDKSGMALIEMDNLTGLHRTELDPKGKEKEWMTYRDYTNGNLFQSLYTGTKAQKALGKKWLYFEDNDSEGKRKIGKVKKRIRAILAR